MHYVVEILSILFQVDQCGQMTLEKARNRCQDNTESKTDEMQEINSNLTQTFCF